MAQDVDPPGKVVGEGPGGMLRCERTIVEKAHYFFKACEVGMALRDNVTCVKKLAV